MLIPNFHIEGDYVIVDKILPSSLITYLEERKLKEISVIREYWITVDFLH